MPNSTLHEKPLQLFIDDCLGDPQHGWSVGTFGAIAEFTRDHDEPIEWTRDEDATALVTPRGGLAVSVPTGVRPVAYEALSGRPDRWRQGLMFCLDRDGARLAARRVLTEVGPDQGALRAPDAGSPLFDLGLGTAHVDVCIRATDAALASALRSQVGTSIFDPENPAIDIIKEASPIRVFLSVMARLEVYQRIGSPRDPVPTPEGPHTHLLPTLLAKGRSHSTNAPVPPGQVPVLELHPANPTVTLLGDDRPFDGMHHDAFQRMLEMFPPSPDYVAEKQRLISAVRTGNGPDGFRSADSRAARIGQRIALRQLRRQGLDDRLLAPWLARYEKNSDTGEHAD